MNKKFIVKVVTILVMLWSQSYGFWDGKSKFSDFPEKFQNSIVLTPLGMNSFPFGEIKVKELVKIITQVQLSDGNYLRLQGWENKNNIYTLKIKGAESKIMYLKFVHLLNKPYNGGLSYMTLILNNREFQGKEFMFILERAGLLKH